MRRLQKSHFIKWLFYLIIAPCVAGCSTTVVPVQLAGATMGTTWHVSYIESTTAPPQQQVQEGIAAILSLVNRQMSTYVAQSEVSAFNALQSNVWFPVSDDVFSVISAAVAIGQQSEGAYDITVAPLVELWGFGASGVVAQPPLQREIASAMQRVGQNNVVLDRPARRIMKRIDLGLDLSSLAKGYAVDRVAVWLKANGIQRFMVEIGGELRVSGYSGRSTPWRIAIEQPETSGGVAAALEVSDVSVATSGDYRNYFEVDGQRYSHMIDPRSGYPVIDDLVSVTVVHESCMIADAWATALAVLGAERAMAVAQAQGLAVYFIRRAGDDYAHSHTPLLSGYLAHSGNEGAMQMIE